jgi:hypothetical protein
VKTEHAGTYDGVVPWEVAEELIEAAGRAEGVDDPVVAVAVDDGLVEVEHHQRGATVARRHSCLVTR